jgi:zinc transport system ATP-binding protein
MQKQQGKNMYGVNLDNIGYAYGGRSVLHGVSMVMGEGEFTVILGPNGSGKSTLLKLIAGLLIPLSGAITIHGNTVQEFRKSGRIGYVPQNYGKNTAFPATVEEIIRLGLLSRHPSPGKSEARDIVEQMLSVVDIEKLRKRRLAELSGGQQQRVMVARALAGNPGVLLLDEPTSGVDAEASTKIYELLKQLNISSGITIIMVSHDIDQATKWASKVACINYGLCYYGDSRDFRKHHADRPHPWQ